MKVYFDAAALEKIAKGDPLYSWNYVVREDRETPSEDWLLVATFEPAMPAKAQCIAPALAAIAKREAELRNELNKELAKLTERRNDLVMLEYQS